MDAWCAVPIILSIHCTDITFAKPRVLRAVVGDELDHGKDDLEFPTHEPLAVQFKMSIRSIDE